MTRLLTSEQSSLGRQINHNPQVIGAREEGRAIMEFNTSLIIPIAAGIVVNIILFVLIKKELGNYKHLETVPWDRIKSINISLWVVGVAVLLLFGGIRVVKNVPLSAAPTLTETIPRGKELQISNERSLNRKDEETKMEVKEERESAREDFLNSLNKGK
jgi:hypothetical protein